MVAPVTATAVVLPPSLRWAVRLLGVEAAAVGLLVGFLLYQDLTGEATRLREALAITGYAALMAAALVGLAVALSRRRARARAPAIVLQLLAVVTGLYLTVGGQVWIGVPVGLLGMVVASLLLAPATAAALE